MNYIVFDLEWNQGSTKRDRKRKELPFEIVEIGAVRLNDALQQTGTFHRLIRPQVYRYMHRITGGIIHLTMEDLQQGDLFPEVAADFLAFCGEEYVFCTWGSLDLTELQRNLAFYQLEKLSDKPIPYYDVQKLFALSLGESARVQHGLENAVRMLEIDEDEPFHRALGDAHYTARIFARMDEEVRQHLSEDRFCVPKKKRHRSLKRRRKKAANKGGNHQTATDALTPSCDGGSDAGHALSRDDAPLK